MIARNLTIFAFLLFFVSCQTDLTRKELLDYTFDPENGLYKREGANGVGVEVVYRPSQLMAEQEARGLTLTEHQLDSIQRYFQDIDYFLLRLSRSGQEIENQYVHDLPRFNEVNNYLSFEIGEDAYVVQAKDTFRVADFVRTSTHGSSPSTDILFAFRAGLRNANANIKLIFDDPRFDTGVNVFEFNIEDVKKISAIHLIDDRL